MLILRLFRRGILILILYPKECLHVYPEVVLLGAFTGTGAVAFTGAFTGAGAIGGVTGAFTGAGAIGGVTGAFTGAGAIGGVTGAFTGAGAIGGATGIATGATGIVNIVGDCAGVLTGAKNGGTVGTGARDGGSVPKRKLNPTHSVTKGPSIKVGSTSWAGLTLTLRQSNRKSLLLSHTTHDEQTCLSNLISQDSNVRKSSLDGTTDTQALGNCDTSSIGIGKSLGKSEVISMQAFTLEMPERVLNVAVIATSPQ
jgi:hypothetical protein